MIFPTGHDLFRLLDPLSTNASSGTNAAQMGGIDKKQSSTDSASNANGEHVVANPQEETTLLSQRKKPRAPTGNIGRAPGDNRSAEQISSGPLFSFMHRLKNDSSPSNNFIKLFYEKIGGDWNDTTADPKTRADRAANAERVFDYIDNHGSEKSIPNNQTLDIPEGPTSLKANKTKEELYEENTEPRLLLEFAEGGYPTLQKYEIYHSPNQSVLRINEKNTTPTHATGRPRGDFRTAEQIIAANPILKTLPESIDKERFYQRVGGNWNDPALPPEQRADAAYNAASVLNSIDAGNAHWETRLNQEIDGEFFSPLPPPFDEAEIADGSEAAIVKAFCSEGYAALKRKAAKPKWNNA